MSHGIHSRHTTTGIRPPVFSPKCRDCTRRKYSRPLQILQERLLAIDNMLLHCILNEEAQAQREKLAARGDSLEKMTKTLNKYSRPPARAHFTPKRVEDARRYICKAKLPNCNVPKEQKLLIDQHMIPTFDGKKPWMDYERQLEEVSRQCGWTAAQKLLTLVANLRGKALYRYGMLPMRSPPTYEQVRNLMREHFK